MKRARGAARGVVRLMALGFVCLGSAAVAAEPGAKIVAPVPVSAIEWEGGCTHYLKPVSRPEDFEKRILMHWGYQALDAPNGKCVANCKPHMNIRGKVVEVQPDTKWPEDLIKKNAKVGDTFSEVYRYGTTTLKFDNRITFVCPPESEQKEPCEVVKFDGLLTVTDGSQTETHQTIAMCGM